MPLRSKFGISGPDAILATNFTQGFIKVEAMAESEEMKYLKNCSKKLGLSNILQKAMDEAVML